MEPTVSIIIPVYNAARFLEKTLASILTQTYQYKEIIVIDDASTDNSVEIVRSFKNEIIKLIRQSNSGAAVARNTGISNASGDYIQFMDADDFLSKDKIEKQVMALKSAPHKVAVCNYINFFNDEELQQEIRPDDQSSFIYSSDKPADFLINLWGGKGTVNFIQTNSWLIPRSVVQKAGGWRNYRCPDDDGEFFTRVLLASNGVVYVPGVYNFYRRSGNENKLSQNSSRKYVQNVLLTIDLKHRYLSCCSTHPAIKKAIATLYLNFAVHNYPQQKLLSLLAYRKYKSLGNKMQPPQIGGRIIESVRIIFGWKFARMLKYLLSPK